VRQFGTLRARVELATLNLVCWHGEAKLWRANLQSGKIPVARDESLRGDTWQGTADRTRVEQDLALGVSIHQCFTGTTEESAFTIQNAFPDLVRR
jgi:hypothetical protein